MIEATAENWNEKNAVIERRIMAIRMRVLIGSSTESLKIATKLQVAMRESFFPEVWNQGIFSLSSSIIEIFEKKLVEYDIAVFILTPDDISKVRSKEYFIPRDNLIFEIGLSYGVLGRENTFIVMPQGADIKLPSDLLGIIYAEYDSKAPNLVAEMSCVANLIESAIGATNPNKILMKKIIHVMNEMDYLNNEDYYSIVESVYDKVLNKKVIRRAWTINLKYDLSKINENIIVEKIIWDYEMRNISSEILNYPLKLFYLDNSALNELKMYTKAESGKKRYVFKNKPRQVPNQRGPFIKRQSIVSLKPNYPYYITMEFDFEHPVSPSHHYVHNCFAPLDATIGFRLVAEMPAEYTFGLLCDDNPAPLSMDCSDGRKILDYRISSPLLPEQVIEYILEKRS